MRTDLTLAPVSSVLVDFLPPRMSLTSAGGLALDYRPATQPDRGAVAHLPYRELNEEGQRRVFSTLIHGKPYIGGLPDSYLTSQHRQIGLFLEQFPDAENLVALQELGVAYVIVDGEWCNASVALDDVELALGNW